MKHRRQGEDAEAKQKTWAERTSCVSGVNVTLAPSAYSVCRCGSDGAVSATRVYFIIKDYQQPTAC